MLQQPQQLRTCKRETGFVRINFFQLFFILIIAGVGIGSYFKIPQRMDGAYQAMRQDEDELLQQRYILLSQLPVRTQAMNCIPLPSSHSLKCKLSEEGMLRLNFKYMEVPVPADVPLSSITFIAGAPDNFSLEFGANLTKEQRRALLRTIKVNPAS